MLKTVVLLLKFFENHDFLSRFLMNMRSKKQHLFETISFVTF